MRGARRYTPGPWKVATKGRRVYVNGPQDGSLASVMVRSHESIRAANARLLAAAPLLMEALEDVLSVTEKHRPERPGEECVGEIDFRCVWCRARAAVATAQAESDA